MRNSSKSGKVTSINRKAKQSTTSSPSTNPEPSKKSSPTLRRVPKPGELVRAAAALRRLGIKKDDLAKCPPISDMLARAYAKGERLGNPKDAVDDLRFSPDPVAQKFIAAFDEIPARDRQCLSIEAVCLKAEVSPQEFLGHVFLMRQSLSKAESSLVAVNSFPDVVRDMVASASLIGLPGAADRKMLAQHSAIGFLPSPKGASLSVKLFSNGDASFSGGEDEDSDDDPEFAGFDDAFSGGNKELETWNQNRRLLLEGGK